MSDCHNCILLMRAAGAARRHIQELVTQSRAPHARPPAEETWVVMERIKVAVEVAGGVRKPAPPPPPKPKVEFFREGGIGYGELTAYHWAAFLFLIGACLYSLGATIWRALGGP